MKQKKSLKIIITILLIIIIILTISIIYNIYKNKLKSNNDKSTNIENIILYEGMEISTSPGIQDVTEMKNNDKSYKKYNTTYYNYENGKYEGTTVGIFGEEVYQGFSIVNNVKKIAMTYKYNAIPREYKTTSKLPEQLVDMANCSSVNIDQIDLDGDGKNEYIVCYTVNYSKDQIVNREPQASSGIILFDSNYQKIANLVSLENGFWANIKEEDRKIFLSLEDVTYIDIDNDNIMEIIIDIPTYEGKKLSIIKYNYGKVDGTTDFKASVLP